MAGPSALAGKTGRVQVGGTNLFCFELDADDQANDIDGTCFEDAPFGTGTIGPEELVYSFKGNWNLSADVFSAPGIYPRDNLAAVLLYPNQGGQPWNMPLARVISAKNTVPVRDKVTYEASGKSQGAFTRA